MGLAAETNRVVEGQLVDAADQSAERGRRPAAIRAMIAYPTNALVEDQMSRLRRAIHALAGRGGPPVVRPPSRGEPRDRSGRPTRQSAAGRTAKEVRLLVEAQTRCATLPVPEGESLEDRLALFTDPRRNEMVVRWDMVQAPPDILVTDFSMLNALLMRDVEANMFACARELARESRGARLHPGRRRVAPASGHRR